MLARSHEASEFASNKNRLDNLPESKAQLQSKSTQNLHPGVPRNSAMFLPYTSSSKLKNEKDLIPLPN